MGEPPIGSTLEVIGQFGGAALAFVGDQTSEVLVRFDTLGEAHAAYRVVLGLTDDLSPISTRDV